MKLDLCLDLPIKKKIPRSQGRPQFPKILEDIPKSGNADLNMFIAKKKNFDSSFDELLYNIQEL